MFLQVLKQLRVKHIPVISSCSEPNRPRMFPQDLKIIQLHAYCVLLGRGVTLINARCMAVQDLAQMSWLRTWSGAL